MWSKENTTWDKKENLITTETFERFLGRLKTYSKCLNSSAYSVTNTLEDVYGVIKYQHAFWVELTSVAPVEIELEGLTLIKNQLYNLNELLSEDVISDSTLLRNYLEKDVAILKSSNSLLFNDEETNFLFFDGYDAINIPIYGTGGLSGTNGELIGEEISWIDGTNGVYDGMSHIDLLIESDFTDTNWKEQFQTSDENNGFTQQNVFTSDKTFEKLLKNFQVIDVASTDNIDIDETFVVLDIDGVRIVNNHRVLLKNQINKNENFIYTFINNKLVLDTTETDLYYLSAFIKEGIENKNKEFFLKRNPNGEFPIFEQEKDFEEGNNYVLRNRTSYKLLADHTFKSSDYFTTVEPIISTNFNNDITIENSGTSFNYSVSEDLKSFIVKENNTVQETIEAEENQIFLPRIELENDIIHIVEIDRTNIVSDIQLYGTNGLTTIGSVSGIIKDFDMVSDLGQDKQVYYITNNDTPVMYNTIFSTSGNITTIVDTFNNDLSELRVLEENGSAFIFYNTSEELLLNYNSKNYLVKKVNNSTNLRLDFITNEIILSWLNKDGEANSISIDIDVLTNSVLWEKDTNYELEFFSKKLIGDWEIINEDLYLKDIRITNLGTNFVTEVPRISSGDRLYDGKDDYSELPLSSFDTILNSGGDVSLDFKVTPSNLRINQPVFYFGNLSKLIRYRFRSFRFRFQLPPTSYMTFYVNDTDDFPYFMISHSGKTIKIKANKKLQVGVSTSISFTWAYTSAKAVGTLYFDGVAVGSVSDQRVETGQVNIPLDIRNINYEKLYFGKSEFNTSPLYEGELSEFRIWNRVLNPSQVLSRINKSIEPTDILYNDLSVYWKLVDFDAIHIDSIGTNDGVFYGGLNLDPILPEIESVQQIQKSETDLYVLDHKDIEYYSSDFDNNQDIFNDDVTTITVEDPLDITNNVVLLDDTTNTTGMNFIQNVRINDTIDFSIDSLYMASTSGNILGGSIMYNLQDVNNNILFGTNGLETFEIESTIPNTWNELWFNYVIPTGLTYNGINPVDSDDIYIQIIGFVDSGTPDTYYDNFDATINRNIPRSDIYKFILLEEKVVNIYSTLNGIDSLYLENENLYFLETEPNDVYLYNDVLNVSKYTNSGTAGAYGTNSIIDFTVVEDLPYMLREDYLLHDNNDATIYNSDFDSLETIYGKKQLDNNKLNIYWKENNEQINLLSDDYSDTTSGLALSHIASYPLTTNNSVDLEYEIVSGTNTIIVIDEIEIVNNRVLSNSVDLDMDNLYWSINQKEIFGVYTRSNRLLVGVKTTLNQIQIWMYEPVSKSYIRFVDSNNLATFFVSDSIVDLTYYVKDEKEYLLFNDSSENKMLWFIIENDNKFAIDYTPQELIYEEDYLTKEIQYNTDTSFWMLLSNNEKEYLSRYTNTSLNYGSWENNLVVEKNTNGWITGDSGLLFIDDFSSPWNLEFDNIIFKDDFNDVETIKTNTTREEGHKVLEWSGKGFMVGNQGRIVRSLDNGTNFEVLNSNTYHDLNSVSFINDRDGLIVGENNTILATFSGGDSFIPVITPEDIGFRSWKEVIYYKPDNAIIIGSNGTIIHLIRNEFNWNVSKILNDLKLTLLETPILPEDLTNKIDLNYIVEFEEDIYNGTINSIDYLGNDDFLLCGDNGMLCKLKLQNNIGYKTPIFNFFEGEINCNWTKIKHYNDVVINEKRAFVLNCDSIFTFEWDRFLLQENTNIKQIELIQFHEHNDTIVDINHTDNYLVSVGDRVSVSRHTLFEENIIEIILDDVDMGTSGTSFINVYEYNNLFEEQDLKEYFLPRMLFTDYYMGRKINIHLEDGSYIKPTTSFEKSLLDCYSFIDGESIEFTDYGTINQNNYLAYQDFYYMNRRALDGGTDKFAKMESEYNKYNKKIEAVTNWSELYSWEANACSGEHVDGTSGLSCEDNLLSNGDFENNGISWENDISYGTDEWYFTSGKARVIKTELFLPSTTAIIKQDTSLFKNIEHIFEYEITNTGGGFIISMWGYKINDDKVLLGQESNPGLNSVLNFTPIEDYVGFGISIDYTGTVNQTITLDNLSIDIIADSFKIFNSPVTDPLNYTTGLYEESFATKISLDPDTFIVEENDVINVIVTEQDKNKVIVENDTIFIKIKNPVYDIYQTAVVTNGQLDFGFFEVDSIDDVEMTANFLEIELFDNSFALTNQMLKERCLDLLTENQSTQGEVFGIEVGKIIVDTTTIVKEYINQTITIYDLFDDEMVEEIKQGRLFLSNLNYFNGDLIHLEQTFNKHLLSDSYDLNVREDDIITVNGFVNDLTKYYDLESNLIVNTFTDGTAGTNSILLETEYPIKYSEDVIYGANYNILSFLNNLNSTAFVSTYELDLPNHTFTYNSLNKNGLDEFKEFFITDSRIFVGEDLIDILEYEQGTFIDVIGNKTIKRVHINKITSEFYEKYPDKIRYIIHTDINLSEKLTLSGNISLRVRNTLGEISNDLEFTDDLMIPIPNQGTNGHETEFYNRGYFKQTRTASKYAKILMNDDTIRKHITSVVYLDDESDWNLNVIDWKSDPNFFYRPVEIHEVGIDKVLKKAISVDSSNYLIEGNNLNLINIDFEKYNYRLVDKLTVKELEQDFSWVLNAELRNAIIGRNEDGLVWYEGDWLCGTWEDGIWYSGTALNIEWITGEVFAYTINNNYNLIEVVEETNSENTLWYNATWYSGNWNDGIWRNGVWNTGSRFKGEWYNGTWKGGIWESGIWTGGTWLDGTWLEGTFSEENAISVWENGTWLGGDFENGTWKNGTWDETNRVSSRFGTKASLLHKAIWEYGQWKNGEFHSGLTLNENNETIASEVYKNSIWKNGIWEKGDFYGGIWENGRWNNGNWFNGLWRSDLDIVGLKYKQKVSGNDSTIVEVEFSKKHYFKEVNSLNNYFIILGEPEINQGILHPNTELLGYNMNPVSHNITEIISDTKVLIEINDINFPYPSNATSIIDGTSGFIDESIPTFMSQSIDSTYSDSEDIISIGDFVYVAYSGSNKVVKINTENEISEIVGTTPNVSDLTYNSINEELYANDPLGNTIKVIDIATGQVNDTINVGTNPISVEMVYSQSKAYSADNGGDSVSDIDIVTNTSTQINTGVGTEPFGLKSVGDELFISCNGTNQVKVLNTISNTVLNTIVVGTAPTDIVYDSINDSIYVINSADQTISVIDGSSKSVITTINIGIGINNIRYIEETGKVYVMNINGITVIDYDSVVDSFNYSDNPIDIVYYPEYDMLLISNETSDSVYSVDSNSHEFIESVDTEDMPGKMVYHSSTKSVYVLNSTNNITRIRSYNQDIVDVMNCTGCIDYTLKEIIVEQYNDTDFEILRYETIPEVASHWIDGTFNQGIWEFGWFNNGTWKGGIWIDGVFENGLFGGV